MSHTSQKVVALIARAIRYAIEQPAEVGVNEIIVRPMGGAF